MREWIELFPYHIAVSLLVIRVLSHPIILCTEMDYI